jgi:hypothetical protein
MQVGHEQVEFSPASNVQIAERSACSKSVHSITMALGSALTNFNIPSARAHKTTDFACRVLMHAVSMFPRSCGTKRNNPI